MAGLVGQLINQIKGLRNGESAPVGTDVYSVPWGLTAAATKPVRGDGVPIQGVVRLTASIDCWYRLDGENATAIEPSIPLTAGVERYVSVRPGKLPKGKIGFSVIAGGVGTLNIDIIV